INVIRPLLSEQHDVVAHTAKRVAGDDAIWKHLEEGGDFALDSFGRALIELNEQRDDPAWIEMRFRRLEELARVERCGAFGPRVERVGGDTVELLFARQEIV